jgi:hypothetical protein
MGFAFDVFIMYSVSTCVDLCMIVNQWTLHGSQESITNGNVTASNLSSFRGVLAILGIDNDRYCSV